MNQVGQSAESAGKRVQSAFSGVAGTIKGLAAAAGIGFGVSKLVEYAETYTNLQNRLRLVTVASDDLSKATGDVFAISLRTSQSVDTIAEVYQRFAQNAGTLGLNLQDVASLTDTVAKAVAISGGSVESARAALTQFGQALASGQLRGEELNSVLEQTPGLAQAIAQGMGVTVGSLRTLAAAGKITSEDLVKALGKAQKYVDDLFNTRVITPSQAFTDLGTAISKAVGTLDTAAGASSTFAGAIESVAQAIGSTDFNKWGLDIRNATGIVSGAWDAVTTGLGQYHQAFESIFGDTSTLGNFSGLVRATAKEIDSLASHFVAVGSGIIGIFETVGTNISNIFSNAFNGVLNNTTGWVNDMIDRVNKVTGFIQIDKIGGGDNRPTDQPTAWVGDAFTDRYQKALKGFNLGAQDAFNTMDARNYFVMMSTGLSDEDKSLQATTSTLKKYTAAVKTHASEGDRMVKSLQNQINGFGEYTTAVEKLQAQLSSGTIKFDSPSQQNLAMGQAATLDFLNEYKKLDEDNQKRAKEASKVFQGTTDDMTQYALQAARNIQDYLGDGLYDVVTGNFEDIGTSFLQLLTRMATQAAAANIGKALFGDFGNTSQVGGLFGQIVGYLKPAITSVAGGVAGGVITGGGGGNVPLDFDKFMNSGPKFETGGYTGDGAQDDIAGFVHKGEWVVPASAVKRLGIGFLQSLNGYQKGGLVGSTPGTMPNGAESDTTTTGNGAAPQVNIYITPQGNVSTNSPNEFKTMGKLVGDLVKTQIEQMQIQSMRQGGTLWKASNGMVST